MFHDVALGLGALLLLPFTLSWLALAACIAFFVLLMLFEGWEAPGSAALFAAAVCGVLWYLGVANVPVWIFHHPLEFIIAFAGYFAVGALWAGYKFSNYGYDRAQDYKAAKTAQPGNKIEVKDNPAFQAEIVASQKESRATDTTIPRTISVDTGEVLIDKNDYIPLALQNKHKITNWIVLWWLSMIKYVFGEMFQHIVDFIIEKLGTIYNRLAARHFDGMA